MPHILQVSPTSAKASMLNCRGIFSSPDFTGNQDQFVNAFFAESSMYVFPPTILSFQNKTMQFILGSWIPDFPTFYCIPLSLTVRWFFFFFTAVTKIGRILTLNFRTSSMRGGYFTHFTLLSTHLGIRSIFVGTGMTLLIHKVCSLVERSDTRHCRTSA